MALGDHNGFVSGSYLERFSGFLEGCLCLSSLFAPFFLRSLSFIQVHKSLLDQPSHSFFGSSNSHSFFLASWWRSIARHSLLFSFIRAYRISLSTLQVNGQNLLTKPGILPFLFIVVESTRTHDASHTHTHINIKTNTTSPERNNNKPNNKPK